MLAKIRLLDAQSPSSNDTPNGESPRPLKGNFPAFLQEEGNTGTFDTKAFAEKLEKLREHLTQKEFAKRLGIPLTTYTNWIAGIRRPSVKAIVSICSHLGVPSDWLLGLAPPPARAGGLSSAPGSSAKNGRGSGDARLIEIIAKQHDLIARQHQLIECVTKKYATEKSLEN